MASPSYKPAIFTRKQLLQRARNIASGARRPGGSGGPPLQEMKRGLPVLKSAPFRGSFAGTRRHRTWAAMVAAGGTPAARRKTAPITRRRWSSKASTPGRNPTRLRTQYPYQVPLKRINEGGRRTRSRRNRRRTRRHKKRRTRRRRRRRRSRRRRK